MKLVSIVIPAYNEAAFIGELLRAIAPVDTRSLGFEKEILVVNDGSTDATEAIARSFEKDGVKCFTQVPNQGKGKAVQRGIQEATGDYILIQDADLEYDPADYLPLLAALGTGVDAVYGSRVLGQLRASGWSLTPGKNPAQGFGPWFAGVVLSFWTLASLWPLDFGYVNRVQTVPRRSPEEDDDRDSRLRDRSRNYGKANPRRSADRGSAHLLSSALARRRQENQAPRWIDRRLDAAPLPLQVATLMRRPLLTEPRPQGSATTKGD